MLQNLFRKELQNETAFRELASDGADWSCTFGDLCTRVTALSEQLLQSGIVPRDVVAIVIPRSLNYVVAAAAIYYVGAVFLPLSAELLTEDIYGATAIITDDSSMIFDKCPLIVIKSQTRTPSKLVPLRREEDIMYLMLTSGSSGTPKVAICTESGTLNRLRWMWETYPPMPGENYCFSTATTFVDSICQIFATLCEPNPVSCVILPPSSSWIPHIGNIIQSHNISRLVLVPSIARIIFHTFGATKVSNCPKVRFVTFSGEALHESLANESRRWFPNAQILNVYGSTEVSADCTFFQLPSLQSPEKGDDSISPGFVPIGFPIPGNLLYLRVEPGYLLEPVGTSSCGKVGELCVGGVGVALGYKGVISSNRFPSLAVVGRNDNSQVRVFCTGDLVRVGPLGELHFLSRLSREVKVKGMKVSLSRVESVLLGHPDIAQCAVFVDSTARYLVAAVVLREYIETQQRRMGGTPNRSGAPGKPELVEESQPQNKEALIERLLGALSAGLPTDHFPSQWQFYSQLPLNLNGKVDYFALQENFIPRSDLDEVEMATNNGSKDEILINAIISAFASVLRIPQHTILATSSYRALGGDSIMAAYVATTLESTLHIDVRAEDVIVSDTPKVLAARLASRPKRIRPSQLPQIASSPLLDLNQAQNVNENEPRLVGYAHYSASRMQPLFDKESTEKQWKCSCNLDISSNRGGEVTVQVELSSEEQDQLQRLMYHEKPQTPPRDDGTEPICEHGPRCEKLWRYPMEKCVDSSPVFSTALWQGQCRHTVYCASHSGLVVALDPSSGAPYWRSRLPDRVEATPAISSDGRYLFVGCYDHNLYCLDAHTGAIFDKFPTKEIIKCCPLIDDRGLIWFGSHDQHIYVLRLEDKLSLVWSTSVSGAISATPCFDSLSRIVFVPDLRGELTAVKPLSLGEPQFGVVWQHRFLSPVFSSPIFCAKFRCVIAACVQGQITAISVSGAVLWTVDVKQSVFASLTRLSPRTIPQTDDDHRESKRSKTTILDTELLLVGTGDNHVHCLSCVDGNLLWKLNVTLPGDPTADSIVTAVACVEHGDGYLGCVISRSGNGLFFFLSPNKTTASIIESARLHFTKPVFSSPVLHNNLIFVGGRSDYLSCVKYHPQQR